jgi:hypothetical protein
MSSMTELDTAMMDKKSDFLDLTHQLNNYNTLYNLNTHLQNIHTKELDTLTNTDNQTKSVAMKSKQQYMLLDYGVNEYALRSNLMYFTLIVASAIIILCSFYAMGTMTMTVTILSVTGMLILWAIVVLVVVKVNSNRRKYAWNQYNWRAVNGDDDKTCKK